METLYYVQFQYIDYFVLFSIIGMIILMGFISKKNDFYLYNKFYKLVITLMKLFYVGNVSWLLLDNFYVNDYRIILKFFFEIVFIEIVNMLVMTYFGRKITHKKFMYELCFMLSINQLPFGLTGIAMYNCICICDIIIYLHSEINSELNVKSYIDFTKIVRAYIQMPLLLSVFSYRTISNIIKLVTFGLTAEINSMCLILNFVTILIAEVCLPCLIMTIPILVPKLKHIDESWIYFFPIIIPAHRSIVEDISINLIFSK